MSSERLINHYAHSLMKAALAKGYSINAISSVVGLDAGHLNSPAAEFKPEHLSRLTWGLMSLMEDEFFGLTRHRCKPGTFAFIAEILLKSNNLDEALKQSCRFYQLLGDDISLQFFQRENRATLQIQFSDPELDTDNLLKEWLIRKWHRFCSWLIGIRIPLTQVTFTHLPLLDQHCYLEVYDCPCLFEASAVSLEFPSKYLQYPINRDRSQLIQLFGGVRQRMDIVSVSGAIDGTRQKLKQLLKKSLKNGKGFPSIETVASGLNISSQTLRRRLKQEGVTYRSLKEDVRQDLVVEYLNDESISLHDIAWNTGFAEPNGLSRAVKAWFGISPSEYRRQRLSMDHVNTSISHQKPIEHLNNDLSLSDISLSPNDK